MGGQRVTFTDATVALKRADLWKCCKGGMDSAAGREEGGLTEARDWLCRAAERENGKCKG